MGRPTPTAWCSWPTATSSTTSSGRRRTLCWSGSGPWGPDMWRVTIKGLLAHKLRLALTALSIVLGVTFIAGTFVLTDTLHNTFNTLFSNIYQNIDFQVRGVAQFGSGGTATRNPVPESVTGYAQYASPEGKAITTGGAPPLGISFDPNPKLSALRLTQGTAPTTP